MTHYIDTDMTAAYLRAVQQECEKANETIKAQESFIQQLTFNLKHFEEHAAHWHSTKEDTPPDGLYIIKTDKGARYLQQLINGKWMPNVQFWMPLPE